MKFRRKIEITDTIWRTQERLITWFTQHSLTHTTYARVPGLRNTRHALPTQHNTHRCTKCPSQLLPSGWCRRQQVAVGHDALKRIWWHRKMTHWTWHFLYCLCKWQVLSVFSVLCGAAPLCSTVSCCPYRCSVTYQNSNILIKALAKPYQISKNPVPLTSLTALRKSLHYLESVSNTLSCLSKDQCPSYTSATLGKSSQLLMQATHTTLLQDTLSSNPSGGARMGSTGVDDHKARCKIFDS